MPVRGRRSANANPKGPGWRKVRRGDLSQTSNGNTAYRAPHRSQRLRHGEAVAIGVALDTLYSHLMFGLDRHDALSAIQALLDLHLPIYDPALASHCVFEGLEEFRQHLGGRLTLTMLKGVGQVHTVHQVDQSVMEQAIEWLSKIHQSQSVSAAL